MLALPQLLLLPWLHRGRWGGCKGMPEGETGAEMCLGIIFMQPVISSASPPKKKRKKKQGGGKQLQVSQKTLLVKCSQLSE